MQNNPLGGERGEIRCNRAPIHNAIRVNSEKKVVIIRSPVISSIQK